MKKSNVVLLIAVLVLTAIVLVVYFYEPPTEKIVLKDFAVEDTASIDKIFLADRNNSLLLEKVDGVWMVNGEFYARKDLINVLLTTIRNIEVSAPVSDAKLDKVLKDLSVTGIKTQIFQNGELVKTYYVGGVTQDNTGTYMIMEGSELPFVTHVPGFTGYLTVRYLPDLKEWREKIIFNYKFDDIAKVRVEYPKNPNLGFEIECLGDNRYGLKDLNGQNASFPVDNLKIKDYLGRIKFIAFEAFIKDDLQQEKLDSLLKEPIAAKFEIIDNAGDTKRFRTYLRPNIDQAYDDDGNLYDWDIDRLYGVVNNETEVVLMQYYILDPITLTINDFMMQNQE